MLSLAIKQASLKALGLSSQTEASVIEYQASVLAIWHPKQVVQPFRINQLQIFNYSAIAYKRKALNTKRMIY